MDVFLMLEYMKYRPTFYTNLFWISRHRDADRNDPLSYADFELIDYAPELMHNEALKFIEKNQNGPFFLYYASPLPHLPLQAPKRWVDFYRSKIGDEEPYTGKS